MRMLDGKVALITGAASGIGRGSALVFAAHGAKVVLADVDAEGGEETARMVQHASGAATFVKTDVTSSREVEALVARVAAEHGRLDCAFNNAGIDGALAATGDCTEENWDRTLAVNLKGVWLCMKYEIRQMLSQGGGAIVNNASAAGLVGLVGLPAYVASKHGVIGLTRTAALEYARHKIRVNAVCPAAVLTEMFDHAIKQGLMSEEQMLSKLPIERFGTVAEIGEAAAWLCSERASFLVGHAMAVDGGWIAQ